MYNITLRQVKNGWLVNVSKSVASQGPATSFEAIMGNVAKSITQAQEGDNILDNIQNANKNFGEFVFKTYQEAMGFLRVLEDDMNEL